MAMLPVHSYTNWGNLRQIMVGRADNACFEPKDQPADIPSMNDPELGSYLLWPEGRKHPNSIARANKQLDNLVTLLEENGVKVVRPDIVDWSKPIAGPDWAVGTQYCNTVPRDSLITFGNIIMEASMSRRDRFFEVCSMRNIVEQLWKTDRNCLWRGGPRNTLSDEFYTNWEKMSNEERIPQMSNLKNNFCLKSDKGVIFDAADFTRTGKHIFGQVSNTTNQQAISWMDRDLSGHGFKVHPTRFHHDFLPSHLDCTFIPLRPGFVLTNPERPLWAENSKMWFENDWEFVEAPQPNNPKKPVFSQSSKWLSINVLSISESKVIVEKEETDLQDLLTDHGFEVLPIAFRDVHEFGGGLHCSTWDITRDDSQVDLFKKWMPQSAQDD